jgi:translation initiation factor 5B
MNRRIRSPIIVMLGHVDHGKTTLLDRIRGTSVVKTEPGLITQYISASYVPTEVVREKCGGVLERMKVDLKVPGLLCIDSPGHEAFTTLRKRGGAIADIAILVVDVNEGFKPQTDESLNFLKQFRTPFVVAATKIDRMTGWVTEQNACFIRTYNEQPQRAQDELEEKLYRLIGQLGERGFQSERFDRVTDFAKQVSIVPVSGITGEGVPDLLMLVAGIAQKYLKDRLAIAPGEGKGTVLEVKEYRGLGTTMDVVIYDGEVSRGDYLVIGGERMVTTRVKALLEPAPLKELRMEKDFIQQESVAAAAGVKIAALGIDGVIAGSPVRAVKNPRDLERARKEIEEEIEEVEVETETKGAVLKADTLGSLEALIKSLGDAGVRIRKARVGNITRSDIMEIRTLDEPVIFAFGLKPSQEVMKLAEDNRIKVFSSDVIYRLIEGYREWERDKKERAEAMLLEKVRRPATVRFLPGCTFRQSRPAVIGVEVIKGTLKPGYVLKNRDRVIGEIKEMQKEGENVPEARMGDKVALSIPDLVVGKHASEGDVLRTRLTDKDIKSLERIRKKLRADELELLEEINDG